MLPLNPLKQRRHQELFSPLEKNQCKVPLFLKLITLTLRGLVSKMLCKTNSQMNVLDAIVSRIIKLNSPLHTLNLRLNKWLLKCPQSDTNKNKCTDTKSLTGTHTLMVQTNSQLHQWVVMQTRACSHPQLKWLKTHKEQLTQFIVMNSHLSSSSITTLMKMVLFITLELTVVLVFGRTHIKLLK